MAQHTPGPWTVDEFTHDIWAPSAKGGITKVADIRGWGYLTGKGLGALGFPDAEAVAVQEANARLIAAAPEMLEMLKEAEKDLVVCQVNVRRALKYDPKWEGVAEAIQPTINGIRDAIAKAEGR